MRAKRFPLLVALVILIALPGCDNVSFGGVQVEVQPPVPPPGATEPAPAEVVEEEPSLLPVDLGPLLYVVEAGPGSGATILPVAELGEDGYQALPDTSDVPDLMERFALGRWEEGSEFTLLGHGGRVGTFVAGGATEIDASTCMVRPRGLGVLEVNPGIEDGGTFLAVPERQRASGADTTGGPRPLGETEFGAPNEVEAAALNVAQRLIPALDVPWPSSIPGVRRDLQAFGYPASDGLGSALAASHVFGGQLGLGNPSPNGYSLFFIAVEGEDRYEPVLSWYQRAESGKAYPRLMGTHDFRGAGAPDAVVEVFGETNRWLAIMGADEDGQWEMLYQDACGQDPARGAIQSYP